jgi:DNA-binding NtrC family response regulator
MLTKEHLTKIQSSILIEGEPGSGKSHLAKWIHQNSNRSDKNFIQVNIASIHKSIFESEIFGHKKGSFTGAHIDKEGFCAKVRRGTLFIDEIGELSMDQQKILLTLIEERIYYPVGSNEKREFNGTFIFATNKNLATEVRKGTFREDLYHRLRAFSYQTEKLSECRDKRFIILDEFEKAKDKHNKKDLTLSSEIKNFLNNYDYPGNYRELVQILDYCTFIADEKVELVHLPLWTKRDEEPIMATDNYYEALEIFESLFLKKMLNKYQGRINYTAEKVKISKVTLISKIKKYGINIQEFKMLNV